MSDETTLNAPKSPNDLKVGMELRGKVKNIELYGAFVDIGTGQDALLHISQLGKANVRNVEDVVKVGDEVTVYVLKVDAGTQRIALSLVKPPSNPMDALEVGQVVTGKVSRIEKFGVFVDIGAEKPGMVHVSELSDNYVKSPSDVVKIGDEVQARIIKIDRKKRQIDLSMKTPPQTVETVEEETTEELPTAMALALRRAMESDETPVTQQRKPTKKQKQRDQAQEEILQRTLRQQSRH
jgi:ribosomal protein S1